MVKARTARTRPVAAPAPEPEPVAAVVAVTKPAAPDVRRVRTIGLSPMTVRREPLGGTVTILTVTPGGVAFPREVADWLVRAYEGQIVGEE